MLHTSPVAIPDERQKTIAISMLGLPDRLKLFQNCQKHDYVSPAIDALFLSKAGIILWLLHQNDFLQDPAAYKTYIRVEFDIFTASIFVSNNGIEKHKYENVIKLVKG